MNHRETAKLISTLRHWCKKSISGLDINAQVISKLVYYDKVKTMFDIYDLQVSDFNNLIPKKQAEEICNRVSQTNVMPFYKAIMGLNIPHIGELEAKYLADKFLTYDAFCDAMLVNNLGSDDLIRYGFTTYLKLPEQLHEVLNWFKNEGGQELMITVKALSAEHSTKVKILTRFFRGKSAVVSGDFSMFPKELLIERLQQCGFEVVDFRFSGDYVGYADYYLLGANHEVNMESLSKYYETSPGTIVVIEDDPSSPNAKVGIRDSFYATLGFYNIN